MSDSVRQSCPTLCDPIDGSPPGSPVPGILQARILEWVAVSFSNACMHAKLLQSCLTLCNPIDSSPPGSSIHRILQARILEWVAITSSRRSSRPVSSALADRFITTAPPGKDSINAITEIHAGRAPCPALLLCIQSFRPYYLNCPWNLRTAMRYIHSSISHGSHVSQTLKFSLFNLIFLVQRFSKL